ncbi:MAG: hypothetical protein KF800_12920 [Lysobacter sp.]|nr:hypothetical protein [Lysobacter sp.]
MATSATRMRIGDGSHGIRQRWNAARQGTLRGWNTAGMELCGDGAPQGTCHASRRRVEPCSKGFCEGMREPTAHCTFTRVGKNFRRSAILWPEDRLDPSPAGFPPAESTRVLSGMILDAFPFERCRSTSVGEDMNRTRILEGMSLLIAGTLLCTACNRQEDPDETARDVSAAAAEGREEIADAARDANEAAADAAANIRDADDASERREAIADARESAGKSAHDLAMEKAEADRDIAKQKCDGLPADRQGACNEAADAAYEKAKTDAERLKDAADERATRTRNTP